ncbi:MAG: 3-hydroxyacyl-CoA dehydrogenase NAD-binding domain-containing protein [Paracoccaceae bacterium]|jgi:3-hydroxybutyryl-CoA dehydrogenase|nr:3-hydroxyacyl-CoA dehydrogenase NAD-binding domain-containing protein [Paracoccaceae bacterium]
MTETYCSLGAGVIGASWTSLFLAHGHPVRAYDPADGAEDRLRDYVKTAWPVMTELELTTNGDPDAITFCATAAEAVKGAAFIQESVPERLPIKHAIYAEIEDAMGADAILSSSASGLTLSQMQNGWRDPARMVLGHPFNPPHLVPLVEVMGNEHTAEGAVERTEAIYKALGKVTIRVRKEVAGHVANRLQAALWREAISLVSEGVTTVEDVDKAIWAGPGVRWAAMGPNMIWHLAAGPGGLASYIDHFAGSFEGWWDDLGDPRLDEATQKALYEGVLAEAGDRDMDDLAAERDALVMGILKATVAARK